MGEHAQIVLAHCKLARTSREFEQRPPQIPWMELAGAVISADGMAVKVRNRRKTPARVPTRTVRAVVWEDG